MDRTLKHRINAGRVAVRQQIDFFRKQLGEVPSEWKEDETRVTFADFAISERVFAQLRRDFPQDDFCSEESNPMDEVLQLDSRYAWVLDPIDGTNNYATGFPVCAISLALLEKGHPVYGIIYDLARDRILQGGPGIGLYDGCRKASIKDAPLDRTTIVGVHFPLPEDWYGAMKPVLRTHRVRATGSGALNLALTAVGLFDGCMDHKVKVWDIAAAYALLVAGGGQFHFVSDSVFPLETFHVDTPKIRYFAGTPAFCRMVRECLDGPEPYRAG